MESKEENPGLGLGGGTGGGGGGDVSCAPVPQRVLEEAAGFALPVNFHGNLVTATTDEQLTEILSNAKACKRPAVVNYGAAWCHACKQMLPTFCNLSNEYRRPFSCMRISTSARPRHRMYGTLQRSVSTGTEPRWNSSMAGALRVFETVPVCLPRPALEVSISNVCRNPHTRLGICIDVFSMVYSEIYLQEMTACFSHTR